MYMTEQPLEKRKRENHQIQKIRKIQICQIFVFCMFWVLLAVFSPRGPENRVRGELLHILVVGELRGMRKTRKREKEKKRKTYPSKLSPAK